jgi:hypothetical protein
VVDQYLRRIEFAGDGYAQLIRLPQYRVAEVTVDPEHAFGRPRDRASPTSGSGIRTVDVLFERGEH